MYRKVTFWSVQTVRIVKLYKPLSQIREGNILSVLRDGPLEKWWGGGGGWGKSQKKIHARENAKKKNSCKEEGKEKKFMQKEGPIVIFI